MKKKYEVKKYLEDGGKFNRYLLRIGGVEIYFHTIKEAEEFYQAFVK